MSQPAPATAEEHGCSLGGAGPSADPLREGLPSLSPFSSLVLKMYHQVIKDFFPLIV